MAPSHKKVFAYPLRVSVILFNVDARGGASRVPNSPNHNSLWRLKVQYLIELVLAKGGFIMNEKKKKTKYYAIKEGKGVKDLIVNTWEECSKLVLGYNSVYKSFLTKEEAERYLKGVNVAKMKEKAIKGMEAKKRQKE